MMLKVSNVIFCIIVYAKANSDIYKACDNGLCVPYYLCNDTQVLVEDLDSFGFPPESECEDYFDQCCKVENIIPESNLTEISSSTQSSVDDVESDSPKTCADGNGLCVPYYLCEGDSVLSSNEGCLDYFEACCIPEKVLTSIPTTSQPENISSE